MRNSKAAFSAIAILLCVSLSCTFLKEKIVNGGEQAQQFDRIAQLPRPDLKAPPSPGAFVIRRLAEMDTSVAPLAEQFEASERVVMQKIVAANSLQAETADGKEKVSSESPLPEVPATRLAFINPTTMLFQGSQPALPGINDGAFVGMITGEFKSMLAGVQVGDYHKRDSKTEVDKETGTTTTMNMEIDLGPDGSTGFGLGVKTEIVKNGVKVTTEMQAKIDGQDCPNAEGQLPITVKIRLSGRSGEYSYAQDVTAFIRVVVNDNADISTITVDTTNGTSRGKTGEESYGEFGATIKYVDYFENAAESNVRTIQHTDNLTQKDATEMSESGYGTAAGAVIGAVQAAERVWQKGGCIKIDAPSPGTVKISSTTAIPVKVLHKIDGSEIAAKLEASLKGESSIDPRLIPKTAGTLSYVAPAELNRSATITLTASCRRGRATLDLNANTGGTAYRVNGSTGGVSFKGEICSLTKPFVITMVAQWATWPLNFTPASESGGQVEGHITSHLITATGSGPYTVKLDGNGAGTIEWSFNGSYSSQGTTYNRTNTASLPLIPAPDLKCN